jgi:hypothetical protein
MLRGSLCPENRRKAVRGGRAACSVVSCVLRFVTAEKSKLLFWFRSDDTATAGGDGGISVAAVSWVAISVGTGLLRDVLSAFSGPTPPSAPAFGVTPEGGKDQSVGR